MRRGPEVSGMFGGHTPSKGAMDLVRQAIDLGINPTHHIKETVASTEAAGKNKIIVRPDNSLGALKNTVIDKRAMRER